jgi:hypothetical protein
MLEKFFCRLHKVLLENASRNSSMGWSRGSSCLLINKV